MVVTWHPELSGRITILTVRNTGRLLEVANFCSAMDTLIDQDGYLVDRVFLPSGMWL